MKVLAVGVGCWLKWGEIRFGGETLWRATSPPQAASLPHQRWMGEVLPAPLKVIGWLGHSGVEQREEGTPLPHVMLLLLHC